MSGRFFKGILLLMVLSAACFLVSPISSGEHPWGSDRGGGDEEFNPDSGSVRLGDSTDDTPDTILVSDDSGDEVNPVPTWFSVVTTVWSSMSAAF